MKSRVVTFFFSSSSRYVESKRNLTFYNLGSTNRLNLHNCENEFTVETNLINSVLIVTVSFHNAMTPI